MKVECEVDYTSIEEGDRIADGVIVTCSRCGHSTQSFGTGEGSIRRCLVLLREECPNGESNFYVSDDES